MKKIIVMVLVCLLLFAPIVLSAKSIYISNVSDENGILNCQDQNEDTNDVHDDHEHPVKKNKI